MTPGTCVSLGLRAGSEEGAQAGHSPSQLPLRSWGWGAPPGCSPPFRESPEGRPPRQQPGSRATRGSACGGCGQGPCSRTPHPLRPALSTPWGLALTPRDTPSTSLTLAAEGLHWAPAEPAAPARPHPPCQPGCEQGVSMRLGSSSQLTGAVCPLASNQSRSLWWGPICSGRAAHSEVPQRHPPPHSRWSWVPFTRGGVSRGGGGAGTSYQRVDRGCLSSSSRATRGFYPGNPQPSSSQGRPAARGPRCTGSAKLPPQPDTISCFPVGPLRSPKAPCAAGTGLLLRALVAARTPAGRV